MNYLETLIDLDKKVNSTDSIKEKSELEKQISDICFTILDEIYDIEEKNGIEDSFRIIKGHWNPLRDPQYGTYSCCVDSVDEVIIYHNYTFRGESEIDVVLIPSYVFADLENGVKRYSEEKDNEHQENLRKSIIKDLKHIKNKFGQLKSIPADFQKIIDDEFWNLF